MQEPDRAEECGKHVVEDLFASDSNALHRALVSNLPSFAVKSMPVFLTQAISFKSWEGSMLTQGSPLDSSKIFMIFLSMDRIFFSSDELIMWITFLIGNPKPKGC